VAKILIVEDDAGLANSVKDFLEHEHHTVDVAVDFDAGWEHLQAFGYDVIILDWQLPNGTGVDLCKRFRDKGGSSPVVMLTGLASSGNKIQGLDAGADDYITKPVDIRELLARIRALLRRPAIYSGEVLKARNLELNTRTRIVTKDGAELKLKPSEYDVLEFLMRRPNEAISPDSLLRQIWDSSKESSLDAVYTCINRLRKKVNEGEEKEFIKTVHGVGYRFVSE
jgi:OmpR-family two-component system manganese-sensing response regulator